MLTKRDMGLKTCLLVSDDPDDHVQFAEAWYEVASDMVLLVVADANKALELLSLKRHIPEYIILDLALGSLNSEVFFNTLGEDPELRAVSLIAYGDFSHLSRIQNDRVSAFVGYDISYSRLRSILQKVVSP